MAKERKESKANVFTASAERTRREQADIEAAKPSQAAPEELMPISGRVSKALHRKIVLHRLETGESMNRLIVRLLEEELADVDG